MYQERQNFIDSINQFIQTSKASLNHVLEELDWSKESIYSALHKQLQSSENVNKSDESLPSSTGVGIPLSIGLNNASVALQPRYSDLVESLSQASSNQKQDGNKSRAEVLAEMLKMERDSKRRRINYKNRVHTKHKSHIEIMREVLAEQMATLLPAGAETASFPSKETETEKVEPELIEIQFPGGNPHTAWRTILDQVTQERKTRRENPRDRDQDKLNDRHTNRSKDSDYSNKKKDRHSDKYDKYRSHRKSDKYKFSEHDESRSREHSNDRYNYKNDERNYKSYKKSRHSEEDNAPIKDKSHKNDKNNSYKEKELGDAVRKENKKKKNHKRDRSSSSSPKRHKTKKHKSKHKSH